MISIFEMVFLKYDFSKISTSSNFTLFLMKSYWVKSIACVPSCGRSFCKLIYKKLLTLTKTCGSFRKNYDQNATSMHILSQFKVWMTLMPLNEFRVSQWSPKSFWSICPCNLVSFFPKLLSFVHIWKIVIRSKSQKFKYIS